VTTARCAGLNRVAGGLRRRVIGSPASVLTRWECRLGTEPSGLSSRRAISPEASTDVGWSFWVLDPHG